MGLFRVSLMKMPLPFDRYRCSYPYVLLLGVFLISRFVFFCAGVRPFMHTSGLWQFLDHDLLRTELALSLLYQHSQPPLWNLALGLSLKAFGDASLLIALNVISTVVAAFSIYYLSERITRRPFISFAASAVFVISPASILYENWAYNSQFVAGLLVASVALALRARLTKSISMQLLLALALAALTLTRPTYHLILIPIVGVIAWWPMGGRARGRALMLVLIAGFLPALVYGKNLFLFEHFGASSWIGMNLAKTTVVRLNDRTRKNLVREHRCDPILEVESFAKAEAYRPFLTDDQQYMRLRVKLAYAERFLTGYNSLEHLVASRRLAKAVFCVLRNAPIGYARAVQYGLGKFLTPASDYNFLIVNRLRIAAYEALFNRVVWLQPISEEPGIGDWSKRLWSRSLLLTGLVAAWMVCLSRSRKWLSVHDDTVSRGLPFVLGSLFFGVALLSIFVEVGENQRYRYEVEPLMYVFIAYLSSAIHLNIVSRMRGISSQ